MFTTLQNTILISVLITLGSACGGGGDSVPKKIEIPEVPVVVIPETPDPQPEETPSGDLVVDDKTIPHLMNVNADEWEYV